MMTRQEERGDPHVQRMFLTRHGRRSDRKPTNSSLHSDWLIPLYLFEFHWHWLTNAICQCLCDSELSPNRSRSMRVKCQADSLPAHTSSLHLPHFQTTKFAPRSNLNTIQSRIIFNPRHIYVMGAYNFLFHFVPKQLSYMKTTDKNRSWMLSLHLACYVRRTSLKC